MVGLMGPRVASAMRWFFVTILLSVAWRVESLRLRGCGPNHDDITSCDYLAGATKQFPTNALTISMWVKASHPHTRDRQAEGEALFSFSTPRTIAQALQPYKSSEVGIWQYYQNNLLFLLSNGNQMGYTFANMRTDNATAGACKDWCFLSFTWEKGGSLSVFKDANLVKSGGSYSQSLANEGAIMLANRGLAVYPEGNPPGRPSVERQYRGDMQDVRIYSRALRAEELKEVMVGRRGVAEDADLRFYWSLFGFEYDRQRTGGHTKLDVNGATYWNDLSQEAPIHKNGESNKHSSTSGLAIFPLHNFHGGEVDTLYVVPTIETETQVFAGNKSISSLSSLATKEILGVENSDTFTAYGAQLLGKGGDTDITSLVSEGLRGREFAVPFNDQACSLYQCKASLLMRTTTDATEAARVTIKKNGIAITPVDVSVGKTEKHAIAVGPTQNRVEIKVTGSDIILALEYEYGLAKRKVVPVPPVAYDIIGVLLSDNVLSSDGTGLEHIDVYTHDGLKVNGQTVVNSDGKVSIGQSSTSYGCGGAVRIVSSQERVAAMSNPQSLNTQDLSFLYPTHLLSTDYALPVAASEVLVVGLYPFTLQIEGATPLPSKTVPRGNKGHLSCLKLTTLSELRAGNRLKAEIPFFVLYRPENGRDLVLHGSGGWIYPVLSHRMIKLQEGGEEKSITLSLNDGVNKANQLLGATSEYLHKTSGTCLFYIQSIEDCTAAAAALPTIPSTSAINDNQGSVSYDPKGCYYEGGTLKFNAAMGNYGQCTSVDQCLCAKCGSASTSPQQPTCAPQPPLVALQYPDASVVINILTPRGIVASPSSITFLTNSLSNANVQTIKLSAKKNGVVETAGKYVTTVVPVVPQNASVYQKIMIPSVKLEVVNGDLAPSLPPAFAPDRVTGGMISIRWNHSVTNGTSPLSYYCVEGSEGTSNSGHTDCPGCKSRAICSTPGCVGRASYNASLLQGYEVLHLSVHVWVSDFASVGEYIEVISVGNEPVDFRCNPGYDDTSKPAPNDFDSAVDGSYACLHEMDVTAMKTPDSGALDVSVKFSNIVDAVPAEVYFSITRKKKCSADQVIYKGLKNHLVLYGLKPLTSYVYFISATNEQGNTGPRSDPLVVSTTQPTSPSQVRDIKQVHMYGDGFRVSWLPPLDTGGAALDAYLIRVNKTDGSFVASGKIKAGTTFYEIRDLDSFASYTVEISVQNFLFICTGTSALSEPFQVQTGKPFRAHPPISVRAPISNATGGSYWLGWARDAKSGGYPVKGVRIEHDDKMSCNIRYMGKWKDESQAPVFETKKVLESIADISEDVALLVDKIRLNGDTDGYYSIQNGNEVSSIAGSDIDYQKYGYNNQVVSPGNSAPLNLAVPGCSGVIDFVGGTLQNAVYKLTLGNTLDVYFENFKNDTIFREGYYDTFWYRILNRQELAQEKLRVSYLTFTQENDRFLRSVEEKVFGLQSSLSGDKTIEFWFRVNSKYYHEDSKFFTLLDGNDASRIEASVMQGGRIYIVSIPDSALVHNGTGVHFVDNVGSWSHISMSFSSTAGCTIYQDGFVSAAFEDQQAKLSAVWSFTKLKVGNPYVDIDDIRVWDEIRTVHEVREFMMDELVISTTRPRLKFAEVFSNLSNPISDRGVGRWSLHVDAQTTASSKPEFPSNLRCEKHSGGALSLSWGNLFDKGGLPLLGFKVYLDTTFETKFDGTTNASTTAVSAESGNDPLLPQSAGSGRRLSSAAYFVRKRRRLIVSTPNDLDLSSYSAIIGTGIGANPTAFEKGQAYSLCVVAKTAHSESSCGRMKSCKTENAFTTPSTLPKPRITSEQKHSDNKVSFSISWSVPKDTGGVQLSSLKYNVLHASADVESGIDAAPFVSSTITAQTVMNFPDLKPSSFHRIKISVDNGNQVGTASPVLEHEALGKCDPGTFGQNCRATVLCSSQESSHRFCGADKTATDFSEAILVDFEHGDTSGNGEVGLPWYGETIDNDGNPRVSISSALSLVDDARKYVLLYPGVHELGCETIQPTKDTVLEPAKVTDRVTLQFSTGCSDPIFKLLGQTAKLLISNIYIIGSSFDVRQQAQLSLNNVHLSSFIGTTFIRSAINGFNGAKIFLDNSKITNNTAVSGGAIYLDNSYLRSRDSVFSHNVALERGGAIYATHKSVVTDNHSTYSENEAKNAGGAAFFYGGYLNATRSSYKHNIARNSGGALSFNSSEKVEAVMLDVEIAANTANSGGAFAAVGPVQLLFDKVRVQKNLAKSGCGGGVCLESSRTGSPDLHGANYGLVISENEALGVGGGGICLRGVDLSRTNLTGHILVTLNKGPFGAGMYAERAFFMSGLSIAVQGNTATNSGGGVYLTVSENIAPGSKILNVHTFLNNKALAGDGGALFLSGNASLEIFNSTFTGNLALNKGGTFAIESLASLELIRVKATNSHVTGATGAGGVVSVTTSSLKVQNSSFIGGKAAFGGAIYVHEGSVVAFLLSARNSQGLNDGGGLYLAHNTKFSGSKCTFEENIANGNGGGILVDGSSLLDLSVSSLVVSNKANVEGGGIYACTGSTVKINSSYVNLNVAGVGGGGIGCNSGVDFLLTASAMSGNIAGNAHTLGFGGAVKLSGNSNAKISFSQFIDNNVFGYGAAVLCQNSVANMDQSSFIRNHAISSNAHGGDIHSESSNITMSGTHLAHSSSSYRGGSLSATKGSVVRVSDCSVRATMASVGGALYASGAATRIEFSLSRISYSRAIAMTVSGGETVFTSDALRGGAMYIDQATVRLYTSSLTHTSSDLDAGGIFAKGRMSEVYAESSNFTNCSAFRNGGAISIDQGCHMYITATHFKDNSAFSYGGHIYSQTASVNVKHSDFTLGTSKKGGGAMAIFDSETYMSHTKLVDNACRDKCGGAVLLSDASRHICVFSRVILKHNTADQGGGICVLNKASASIQSSDIFYNTASEGGGVYGSDGVINAQNTTFYNNSASDGGGGALRYFGCSSELINNRLWFNTASGSTSVGGGGLHSTSSKVNLYANEIYMNRAEAGLGGGILFDLQDSVVSFENNNVSSNVALTHGGGIAATADVNITMRHSKFQANSAGLSGGGLSLLDGSFCHMTSVGLNANTAHVQGGGIFASSASAKKSSLVADECVFTWNVARTGNGGAVSLLRSIGTFEKLRTSKNLAYGSGGGIYAGEESELSLHTSVLNNNSALRGGGGAIALKNSIAVKIDASRFEKNIVDLKNAQGSAIYVVSSLRVKIVSSKFYGHGAGQVDSMVGGLMYVSAKSKVDIFDSILSRANARVKGGAIAVLDAEASITNSSISNTYADLGGCVFVDIGSVNISSSTLSNSGARFDGGAAYGKYATVSISKTLLQNISSESLGGGIFCDDQARFTVIDSSFRMLSAKKGAGIYVGRGSNIDVATTTFENCNNIVMGTIFIENNRHVQLIAFATFHKNYASEGGAGLAVYGTTLQCSHCKFSKNTAGIQASIDKHADLVSYASNLGVGAALAVAGTSTIYLNQSTFSENSCYSGGAISIREKSEVHLHSVVAELNLAKNDGGFLFVDASSTIQATKLICMHNQGGQQGGCVSALSGAHMKISSSKFQNNSCSQRGGSIYFPGFALNGKIRLSIDSTEFKENDASAGRSIFWNVSPKFQHAILSCHSCMFDEKLFNLGTKDSFDNNLATSAVRVAIGFFPTEEVESGMPILNTSLSNRVEDSYFDPSAVYLDSLDYYNNIAQFDMSTVCEMNRTCPPGMPYNSASGICGKQTLTSRSMKLTGATATSSYGYIHFKDLKVVAKHSLKTVKLESRGEPSPAENHDAYAISINCKIGEERAFSSTMNKNIKVGLCSPGRQPDGKEVCSACSANSYSLSGLACLPCPAGADCTKSIELQGVKVQVGVSQLRIDAGYWHDDMPGNLQTQCVHDVVESWRNSSCPPGKYYTRFGEREDCKDLVPNAWGEDRLYRCRTKKHIYPCPQGAEACNWRKDSNGTVLACNVGYTAKLCGSCAKKFYRTSNDSCIPCGTEVEQTKLFYFMMFALFIQFLVFVSWLHLREQGIGLLGIVRGCQRKFHGDRRTKRARRHDVKALNPGGLGRSRSKLLDARDKKRRSTVREKSSILQARKSSSQQEAEDAKTRYFRPEKWKILLTFFQIFSQYSSTYDIPWPELVLKYMRMFNIFNLDLLKLVAVDCILEGNLYQSFMITVFVPILAIVWVFTCLLIGRFKYAKALTEFPRREGDGKILPFISSTAAYNTRKKMQEEQTKKSAGKIFGVQQVEVQRLPLWVQLPVPGPPQVETKSTMVKQMNITAWASRLKVRIKYEQFVDKCQHLFFTILLLAYVPVSGKVMRLFRCTQVGDNYYVMSDLQLQCYTEEYQMYISIATACVFLYVAGIPMFFLIMLMRARNAGVSKIWKSVEKNENRKQFWLAHAKAEKEAQNELWQDPTSEKETKQLICDYIRMRNLRSHKAQARFGFICEAYQEKAWWFECFELTRKLALTGGIALIRPGSTTQILAGLSFTAFFSYFAMYFKPYRNLSDDMLYNICLFQLFTVLFIGLLTRLKVSPLTTQYTDVRINSDSPADLRAAAGNPKADDFLPWVVVITHMACMLFAVLSILYELKTAKAYQKAVHKKDADLRNRVRQTLRKWAKARRMALLNQAKKQAAGVFQDGVEESLEDATAKAMLEMERQAEQKDLENEMQQLEELKHANAHLTEADDASLTDEQRQLKEFLLESSHEVSRRKQALSKQILAMERQNEEDEAMFNEAVERKKTKQHDRLMARLEKRQGMKKAVGSVIKANKKNTKVMPVKQSPWPRKVDTRRPPGKPPPGKPPPGKPPPGKPPPGRP